MDTAMTSEERMRAALEPFAKAADAMDRLSDLRVVLGTVRVEHFRAARAARGLLDEHSRITPAGLRQLADEIESGRLELKPIGRGE